MTRPMSGWTQSFPRTWVTPRCASASIPLREGLGRPAQVRQRARPTTTEAVDRDAAVDAENAPTAPWKSLRDSHKRPQPFHFLERTKEECISRLRATKGSENTGAAYRVAAFQTFLSGRI
jgi:hypothetical protein